MKRLTLLSITLCLLTTLGLVSCTSVPTSSEHIEDFHSQYMEEKGENLEANALALYVDNSYCIAEGQHSSFYQSLLPVLTRRCKTYYSIKGPEIVQEDLAVKDAYSRLKSVQDVSYAALKEAAERIASGREEAVLMTDCEYYEQTIARGNTNNAYLEAAFTTWLERGNDIYIIVEPYTEQTARGSFAKKRYYIVWTNSRLDDNIYQELVSNVNLKTSGVRTVHLSASMPKVTFGGEKNSTPAEALAASVRAKGNYEVQDWQIDWSSIQSILMTEMDTQGNASPYGEAIATGIMLQQNEDELLRIDDVRAEAIPLNEVYGAYCSGDSSLSRERVLGIKPAPNFVVLDDDAWARGRDIRLHLDRQNFDPTILDNSLGANFFCINIVVDKVSNALNTDTSLCDLLTFDDIAGTGKNVSLLESVKICLNKTTMQNKLKGRSLYRIYVSSLEY